MSDEAEAPDSYQVAIVGMAGRFPGAPDVETLWENLEQGRESISRLSASDLRESGADASLLDRPGYVPAKGVLESGDLFDAGFFGYSPREAEVMDPQHRVFLECAWEALESAGCDPRAFDGRIGVFAGASLNSYLLYNVMTNRETFQATGAYQTLLASDKDFLSTRVSYKLGLKGPSVTVQTACSTSLTAVHLACQSLLAGECDIALAGGVSVSVPLKSGYVYEQGGILSPDGHCRAFDAESAGTVAGNGAGIVVLRRLGDAVADGDSVRAVIRGTAINNDGSLKAGYTAPSVDGQAEVVAEALAVAGVDAATVGYVEAHGTGTPLGDPIELAALTRAFRDHTPDTGYCAIGSVKTNVGHLDAAAGVTALIKATLALAHEAIPPSLGFSRPNPELGLDDSPFFVNTELRPWPRRDGHPRRAGVSSFGIGGTNVHAVVEEAPPAEPGGPARPVHLLALSGRTPEALAANAERLADHLDRHGDLELGDVAYTLACRRRAFEYRRTVVCRDREEAVAALRRPHEPGGAAPDQAPVAFLFPGQGTQYAGMARDLRSHEPVFAEAFDRCAELFAGHLGEDLRALVFTDDPGGGERLRRTEVAQPALFAVEYALARLWESRGVRPRAMAGHSVGEYVAACLAGVFSLEDAVRLVAVRGRLVQAMPPGAMLTVFLTEEDVTPWLGDGLALAAVNSTALSVVSGPTEAVADLERRLKDAGIACRRLHTSHAFHSPSMEAAVRPFAEEVRQVTRNAPRIPFCSGVTGTWITAEQATSPEYWGEHLRRTVRFGDALGELLGDPSLVLLEVGPGRTLGDFVRRHRAGGTRTVLGSLRHPNERRDDRAYLLDNLGALWSAGGPVDWSGHFAGEERRPLALPAYAFQRQRYWVEPGGTARAGHAALSPRAGGLFSTPGWRRLTPQGEPAEPAEDALWVVLGADLALGRDLARRLESEGATVVRVCAAGELRKDGDRSWSLDPVDRKQYAALLSALADPEPAVVRIVHLWSLAHGPAGELDADRLDRARRLGFDTLLALAQGIGDAGPPAPVAIDVLCRGVHEVTGEEPLQPENATLLGVCTVIPQEVADVTCRTLDVTGADPADPGDAVVGAVCAVLGRITEERDLALRGRHWWARDFDAVNLEPGPGVRPRLRDGGVYLITGGLGGVGLALAEHIARSVEAPVLGLLGRSPLPAEETWESLLAGDDPAGDRIRGVLRLRELGARVVVLQADVTDLVRTTRAVEELRAGSGPINGVVHAAGLPSRGMIAGKSREDAGQVMAAKTRGTLVLDRVCAGDDPDFVLLCSSLTSLLGGPGQSDYAAANAFLDAFAQAKRRETGALVTAVAWDTWRGVGMAAGLTALTGGGPAGEPTGHPLLRLVRAEEETRTYAATLGTDNWILDDHRIMGRGLVPGTTYLELARAAVADQAGDRMIELQDVLFALPLIVPDGQTRDVYVTVAPREDELHFTVRSRAGVGVWQEHASGGIRLHDPGSEPGAPVVRDLDEIRRAYAGAEVIETEEEIKRRFKLDLVEKGGRIEFAFGPRWQCLRTIQVGDGRLLVTLSLDEEFRSDLDGYALHPALLDVAGASARIHARDVFYLPFTYRRLQIWSGLTPTIHCHVTLKEHGDASGETLTCDTEILAPDGRLLARIVGFTIKRINDIDGLLEQIERASAVPEETGETPGGVLRTLGEGMTERDGVEAFSRILAAPSVPGQLVVSPRDLAGLRRIARSITPALLVEEVERIGPPGGTHPRPDLATPYVAPVTEEEQAVAAIWQEVLGIDRVGVDDDFFALGGHSLAAVQIGAKIRGRFGADLELRDFFERPTVAGTVVTLAAGPREETGERIRAVTRDEPGDGLDLDGLDELSDEEVEAALQELLAEETGERGESA